METPQTILLSNFLNLILEDRDGFTDLLEISTGTVSRVRHAIEKKEIENKEINLSDLLSSPHKIREFLDELVESFEENLEEGDERVQFNQITYRAKACMVLDDLVHDPTKKDPQDQQGHLANLATKIFTDKPLDGSSNDMEVYLKASVAPILIVLLDTLSGTLPNLDSVSGIIFAFVLLAVLLAAHGFDRTKEGPLLSTLTQIAPRGLSLFVALAAAGALHVESESIRTALVDPNLSEVLTQGDSTKILEYFMNTGTISLEKTIDSGFVPRDSIVEFGNQVAEHTGIVGQIAKEVITGWRNFCTNKFQLSATVIYGAYQLAKGMFSYLGASQMSQDKRLDDLLQTRELNSKTLDLLSRLRGDRLHGHADKLVRILSTPDQYTLDQSENAISVLCEILGDQELKRLWHYDPSIKDELLKICVDTVEGNGFHSSEKKKKKRKKKKAAHHLDRT